MTGLVVFMLTFAAVGIVFLFVNLLAGKLVRPHKPDPEKLTTYECGEPTIGSAWIQFDLRFYVVALLFVIFDVEMAFFFPWAATFGKLQTVADEAQPTVVRQAEANTLANRTKVVIYDADSVMMAEESTAPAVNADEADSARRFAWFVLLDGLAFLGVLLAGFAYLWRRGDLEWVRGTAAHDTA